MATAVNPYAGFLGEREPMDVLGETAAKLTDLVLRLGPAGLQQSYAPGKWTGSVILCHLADCELAFGYRWRQVAAEPKHVIQTFDQDAWSGAYATLDSKLALDSFCAARRWNFAWLQKLSYDDFSRPVLHPERGELTFRKLLAITAGHDLNHLAQFEQIAQKAGR